MATSEKKRAREQRAAARRDRVAQKRQEKAAGRNGTDESPWSDFDEASEYGQDAEAPEESS